MLKEGRNTGIKRGNERKSMTIFPDDGFLDCWKNPVLGNPDWKPHPRTFRGHLQVERR